jgi:signal peptidase I
MSVVPQIALNPSPVRLKRRRWYLAALLSLLCPGLGQLYNTQLRRALTFGALVATANAVTLVLLARMAVSVHIMIAIIPVVTFLVAAVLYGIVDAIIGARRLKQVELRRFNRAWVYIAVAVAWIVLNELSTNAVATASYNIPSGSNIPTLLVGDYLMAEKGYYSRNEPRRGEIAIFKLPSAPKIDYVKRIVGLPGDTIQMIGGRLYINGAPAARERVEDETVARGATTLRIPHYIETLPGGHRYRIREERGDDGALDNTPPYLVPADHYFVLGDNRDNSQDSRVLSEVGFIPRGNFRDRPTYIYWSRDLSRMGLHPD